MIERCSDYRRINKILSWEVVVSDEIYYLMEVRSGIDLGTWTLNPFLDGLAIHADMGPECRGRAAVNSARDAFAWVFENTDYEKIYATIPNGKRSAQLVARWAGMRLVNAIESHRGYLITKGIETCPE